MAQIATALNLGQSVGVPSGPDYITTPAGVPPDPTAAVATISSDLATAFTAADVFGNALVAITGDTYSDTTHQWTSAGSTGLNHAKVVTLMADYNTAITSFVAAQAAATAAHGGISSADAILLLDGSKFTLKNQVRIAVRRMIELAAANLA